MRGTDVIATGKEAMAQPLEQPPPPHGLMFHHFHGPGFEPSQGSIDADTLKRIVDHYTRTHSLLDAGEFRARALAGQLAPGDVCLTFDDSLLCQYEIALPVLEAYGLRAFWFVYSSVVTGNIEVLEVFRRFRSEYFPDVDSFYAAFFRTVDASPHREAVAERLAEFSATTYLAEYPFYSDNDRRFRYVRDQALGPDAYADVMNRMMRAAGTSCAALAEGLWMNAGQLRHLRDEEHVIGLHSHTHPTTLANLPPDRQHHEYAENSRVLEQLLGSVPDTMSHPCNSYSQSTLGMLDGLGIRLGFRSNMSRGYSSPLEYPREDHANIVRALGL